jgi:dipeptidyl aminopeptidase/acylaminoacyl peptidase
VNAYSRFGHIAAGEGLAVFYPNYRGSTGRGERFAKLDHLDAPGEEFWDLVDAIGALSEAGIVDADRVGITGGSYGGFASSWGATIASEHFAASAPFVALTELISFYGTTEIPIEMVDVHFMQSPWEDWTMYLENSPTFHAEGSTTPTLILHGEADTRVDPSQSYILYRLLKMTSEAPVRLVTYPGEGHGNRRAAAQYDYGLRVMRWMQHYLQGEGGEPPAPELPELEALVNGD